MNKDISAQFLCKDCAQYNLCEYYHGRKKDSYICKYFHLPETSKTGWIPVSERLPEKDGEYLVTVQCSIAGHKHIDTCFFTGKVNGFERFGIVAWMPLPEPYKAESEE